MFLVVYRIMIVRSKVDRAVTDSTVSRLENFKVNVSNASPTRIAWIMDKELIASKP